MLLYIVPVVIFLVISISISIYTYDEKKPKINVNAITYGFLISALVFLIMKYKEHSHEPMMPGNYFDTTSV